MIGTGAITMRLAFLIVFAMCRLCAACGNHNFARRPTCRQCQAPKPPGVGDAPIPPQPPVMTGFLSSAAGQQVVLKPGDWIWYLLVILLLCSCSCRVRSPNPTCASHNFARRTTCRQCETPKASSVRPEAQLKLGDWVWCAILFFIASIPGLINLSSQPEWSVPHP